MARIRAVLRRTNGAAVADAPGARLSFADIVLDDDTHEVWKGDREVELSPTEFNLLRYFLQNPGRVLSKRQILEHVWNYDFGGDGNVVESYVSYLRRKVDTDEPRLLHTVRGVGYVLRQPEGAHRGDPAAGVPAAHPAARAAARHASRLVVLVTGLAGTAALRSYLVDRIDTSCARERRAAAGRDPGARRPGRRRRTAARRRRDDAGVRRRPARCDPPPRPGWRRGGGPAVRGPGAAAGPADRGRATSSGDRRWRVLAGRPRDGGTVVVAVAARRRRGHRPAAARHQRRRRPGRARRRRRARAGGRCAAACGRWSRSRRRRRRSPPATCRVRVPDGDPRTEVGSLAASLQRHGRPLRERLLRAAAVGGRGARVRGAHAALRRRRQPRAAHAADLDPRASPSCSGRAPSASPSSCAQVMRRIEDEAARMGLLVEDLLLLARLDQARPLRQEPVDLLAVAADVVHAAAAVHGADPRRPAVRARRRRDPPVVVGDDARLHQVAQQPRGQRRRAHRRRDARSTVRVRRRRGGRSSSRCATTATGMAPEVAARVFERFYRADSVPHPRRGARRRTGSGLGLSIVAALVAAHGGTVDVDTDARARQRVHACGCPRCRES